MILAAALLLQAAAVPPTSSPSVTSSAGVVKTFTGVWLDEFEGTQFFDDVTRATDLPAFGTAPVLAVDRAAVLTAMLPPSLARARISSTYPPHLYRIRFIGRMDPPGDCRPKQMSAGSPPRPPLPGCIGVGGSFPARIEALRVLDLVDLGPLPAGGQPARISSDSPH